jgi:hypothetical protein
MAKRSREHRQEIPGYDESRPTREQRKQQHRANRHAANQMLHTIEDAEEVVLPEERRTRTHETGNGLNEPEKRRYRVWKTKFWKRRGHYRDRRAALDSDWPVITPNQLQEE